MGNLNDHLIDEPTREILLAEYKAKNYVIINDNRSAQHPDSLYYTYDLQVLQEFLDYVKAEAEARNLTDLKVRVSMGQYPETPINDRINREYLGYQTTFFVAGTGEGEDFEAMNGVDGLNLGQLCPP